MSPRLESIVRRPAAPSRPAGTRHHDTGEVAVVAERPRGTAPIDPLLRRMGTLAVIIALAIPAALVLRPGSDPSEPLRAEGALVADTQASTGDSAAATAAADAAVAGSGSAEVTAGASVDATAAATVAAAPSESSPPTDAQINEAPAESAGTSSIAAVGGAADASAEAETVTRAACLKTYTVVAGDYWILIAKKVSVSVDSLLAANAANSSTPLFPGGTICLPANASSPTTVATTAPPTTAKPTTTTATPTTTTAPAPKTYTRAEVEAIIRAVWPDELENEALRIATRESNLVPTAHNWCCHGLFQIYFNVHKTWLAQMGVTQVSQLYDPWVNALAAFVLYQRAGNSFAPWSL